MKSETLNRL